jgi:hypothetical protein
MIEIRSKTGQRLRTSKNLRGIRDYAREWNAVLSQQGKQLRVAFGNGATCEATFASEVVLSRWIDDRVRFGKGKFAKLSTEACAVPHHGDNA